MSTLAGTLVGALVGAFVGPLVGRLVDPLVGSNFAVRVLCTCQINNNRAILRGAAEIAAPTAENHATLGALRPCPQQCLGLGTVTPRPGTEGSRALRARNPKRVQKESVRVSRGLRPRKPPPQSPQRVRPGVRKESKKSPKLRFWTLLFGLRGALFGDSGGGASGAGGLGTPLRTLFGLFWGSGPEGPGSPLCARPGGS